MVRRKLSIAERWQAVGMSQTGLSNRRVAQRVGVHRSVIDRLMHRFQVTGTVDDRSRSGRPRKTTPREDRLIARRARRDNFTTAGRIRAGLHFGGNVSVRTIIRRLNAQHLRARRPIKRPELTARHRIARLNWSRDHLQWNIRNWRRVHWSDESRFLLRPVDGPVRVWRHRKTAYRDENVMGTTAFGGGGVTVWGCFSFNCKLPLHFLQGNLNGVGYRDNVLDAHVVPHFDNHRLADRPIFMDDNARPHRARLVRAFLQQEAIDTLEWPVISPDMNPIEHVWDFIGRKLNQRIPRCRNIAELTNAIVEEWRRFPQDRLRRLVLGMRRRVRELERNRGGYTRY